MEKNRNVVLKQLQPATAAARLALSARPQIQSLLYDIINAMLPLAGVARPVARPRHAGGAAPTLAADRRPPRAPRTGTSRPQPAGSAQRRTVLGTL